MEFWGDTKAKIKSSKKRQEKRAEHNAKDVADGDVMEDVRETSERKMLFFFGATTAQPDPAKKKKDRETKKNLLLSRLVAGVKTTGLQGK